MKHFRILIFVLPCALICLLVGIAPSASAHSVSLTYTREQTLFDPYDPCATATMPQALQITRSKGGLFAGFIPQTTIVIDPCTSSRLAQQKEDASHIPVHNDGSVPPEVVFLIQRAIAAHANDIWQKTRTCPYPEQGVSFTLLTPNWWELGFTPTPLIDQVRLMFPSLTCQ